MSSARCPRPPNPSDDVLMDLVRAIVSRDPRAWGKLLKASPDLARRGFLVGATRASAAAHYLTSIGHYVFEGDTALHVAAAAYEARAVRDLVAAGAAVAAKNRLGDEPLHDACVGSPTSARWNPRAQEETVTTLVELGADANATNKTGVAPLHRAVRTRCTGAVRALLACGANPRMKNKSGSTPMDLATRTTGRGGSGSPEAKREQEEIVRMLAAAGTR